MDDLVAFSHDLLSRCHGAIVGVIMILSYHMV